MKKDYFAGCLAALFELIDSEEMQHEITNYLVRTGLSAKWMIYSDYCLDDANKPNDVITFVLMPFLGEEKYKDWESTISQTQPKDIKKSRSVSGEFMTYMRSVPMFSFSFIFNEREKLFGYDEKERKETVERMLKEFRGMYNRWIENEISDSLRKSYSEDVRKLDRELRELFKGKDLNTMMDIFLISFLGAAYAGKILKHLPELQIVGWFPDRDKTNEACNRLAIPIFTSILHNVLLRRIDKFCTSRADSQQELFYEDFNRIADIICGTFADYDQKYNLVSHDKFASVLEGWMADNNVIKAYRLFVDDKGAHVGEWKISARKPAE